MTEYLKVAEEVAAALAEGRAVVALESTIISHGMPWPDNFETACAVAGIVRAEGAVPATIALIDGKICVGLCKKDIELLARSAWQVEKVSRFNFSQVLAGRRLGATTVAATMWAAAMAGIEVFATGGIGGVHRGWNQTLDISADLEELGRTRVAVVSAGAKAILDLAATLECLETKGVPVIGFGTDEFPAFFSRSSGLKLLLHTASERELAHWIRIHWQLPGSGGVLVANPIPAEHELTKETAVAAVNEALAEAAQRHIHGKALTPFLLEWIAKRTGGKSLEANVALVKHNAALAARLARALVLQRSEKARGRNGPLAT